MQGAALKQSVLEEEILKTFLDNRKGWPWQQLSQLLSLLELAFATSSATQGLFSPFSPLARCCDERFNSFVPAILSPSPCVQVLYPFQMFSKSNNCSGEPRQM